MSCLGNWVEVFNGPFQEACICFLNLFLPKLAKVGPKNVSGNNWRMRGVGEETLKTPCLN